MILTNIKQLVGIQSESKQKVSGVEMNQLNTIENAYLKIDKEKIDFLAKLPSLDELRGKIIGLISAPAQKIASITIEPGAQIARLISSNSSNQQESN